MPQAAGEAHYAAKLTDDGVRQIMASTDSVAKIAERLGVSPAAVHFVRVGKAWNHITGLPKIPKDQRVKLGVE